MKRSRPSRTVLSATWRFRLATSWATRTATAMPLAASPLKAASWAGPRSAAARRRAPAAVRCAAGTRRRRSSGAPPRRRRPSGGSRPPCGRGRRPCPPRPGGPPGPRPPSPASTGPAPAGVLGWRTRPHPPVAASAPPAPWLAGPRVRRSRRVASAAPAVAFGLLCLLGGDLVGQASMSRSSRDAGRIGAPAPDPARAAPRVRRSSVHSSGGERPGSGRIGAEGRRRPGDVTADDDTGGEQGEEDGPGEYEAELPENLEA